MSCRALFPTTFLEIAVYISTLSYSRQCGVHRLDVFNRSIPTMLTIIWRPGFEQFCLFSMNIVVFASSLGSESVQKCEIVIHKRKQSEHLQL